MITISSVTFALWVFGALFFGALLGFSGMTCFLFYWLKKDPYKTTIDIFVGACESQGLQPSDMKKLAWRLIDANREIHSSNTP